MDRNGKPTEPPRDIDGRVVNIALSPDNRRFPMDPLDPPAGTDDIWIFDRARESLTRFTSEATNETDPVWSPDSLSLLFSSNRGGPYQLFLQRLDRGGPPARVEDGEQPTFADALALVRRCLWSGCHFSTSSQSSDVLKVSRSLVERLTDAVCYAA